MKKIVILLFLLAVVSVLNFGCGDGGFLGMNNTHLTIVNHTPHTLRATISGDEFEIYSQKTVVINFGLDDGEKETVVIVVKNRLDIRGITRTIYYNDHFDSYGLRRDLNESWLIELIDGYQNQLAINTSYYY